MTNFIIANMHEVKYSTFESALTHALDYIDYTDNRGITITRNQNGYRIQESEDNYDDVRVTYDIDNPFDASQYDWGNDEPNAFLFVPMITPSQVDNIIQLNPVQNFLRGDIPSIDIANIGAEGWNEENANYDGSNLDMCQPECDEFYSIGVYSSAR